MLAYLWLALGGALGGAARYSLSGLVARRVGETFPWGTLAVNVIGSFALGLLLPVLDAHGPLTSIHALLTVGFLGAFTTFSTFAYEAVMLLQEGERARAGLYVCASLGLGLITITAGLLLGRMLF
jgi:fluoride exporter